MLTTMLAFQILNENNVVFACVKQDIDYSTPEGRLFMVMLGGFAQYFSDTLSGHTRKGMRERAQQGMFNGEPLWGYERCTPECFGIAERHTGCHMLPDKAAQVVETFQQYSTGTASHTDLADRLNSLGYRTNGKRRAEIDEELVNVEGRKFTNWAIRDMLKNPFYYGMVPYKDELFQGRHQPLISKELYDQVQEQRQQNQSRRTALTQTKIENTHLLRSLFRCYECGTSYWAQNQGSMYETFYKSPNKGHNSHCRFKGRSFLGREIDAQMNQLFSGFELREDWIDWVVDNHIKGSDIQAALKEKQSLQSKMERSRWLYKEGDIDKKEYQRDRDASRNALRRLYIPEYDDAVEAGNLLRDFGALWQASTVARRNAMAKAILRAVYVNPEEKKILGLEPKETFLAPVLAMVHRTDVAVLDGSHTCARRNGGDGGESNSPSRRAYKPDILQACPPVHSWTLQAPPAHPKEAQPVKSLAALTGVWLAASRTYGA